MYDFWIIAIGALCGMSCALLGCFLVLRRMSMMGDAISHAVLPGLAIAFFLTGSRASLYMFLGAAAVGVLTAVFIQWVSTFGRVERGAAMGVVFTTLFAVGLILLRRFADHVDLDPGCVLYGAIEYTPIYTLTVLGYEVPQAALVLGGVFLADIVFVALFYKELKISSFDPALATTVGINARVMRYLLMTMVAVTTVAAFESIGSILVIAMLIVPAATARLLTDRLGVMLLMSLVVGAASAALGYVSAVTVPDWFGYADTNTSGMMAVVAGALFVVVLLAAPRHGVLSKLADRARLSFRIVQQDLLGLLYRLEEAGASERAGEAPVMLDQMMGVRRWVSRLALARLRSQGKIGGDGTLRLTEAGREEAAGLVRAHRLWETYLAKRLGLAPDHVHAPAERLEHVTTVEMQGRLAAESDRPTRDPHGKDIPAGRKSS